MHATEEQKAKRRAAYDKRCQDPAYLEQMRTSALARYYRRREREAQAGVVRKPVGRPRKAGEALRPFGSARAPAAGSDGPAPGVESI